MASKGGSAAEKHTGLAQLDEDEELDEASAAALPSSLLASERAADFLPMSELALGAEIGHGGFSRVFRGTWTPGGGGEPREVAIKRMPLVDKDAMKYLNSELAILKCAAQR